MTLTVQPVWKICNLILTQAMFLISKLNLSVSLHYIMKLHYCFSGRLLFVFFLVEKLELHDAMKQKIDIERDSFSITTGGKSTIFSEVSFSQPPHYLCIYQHCTEFPTYSTIE